MTTHPKPPSDEPEDITEDATGRRPPAGQRRLQILETIAQMLDAEQPERITTAALAARLGLSEAALYRHFKGKTEMFEGLIEFIEQTLFSLIGQIEQREEPAALRGQRILQVLLVFAERNRGFTRILTGEALLLEDVTLHRRMGQLMGRLEASLRQQARLAQLDGSSAFPGSDPAAAALLAMAYAQGRWQRYAKSGFTDLPSRLHEQIQARLF